MADKNKKICADILRLEAELLLALTKKSHKGKEVNIQAHQEKIRKLKAQLT